MKIFGIGMNYAGHNKELGFPLYNQEPVVFMKPDSALLKDRKPFFVPDGLGRVDYEAELVVRISRLGKSIPERFASRYYDALTVGIDFTARDLQHRLRSEGLPWEMSKGFDGAAAVGEWVGVGELPGVDGLNFRLDVNGTTVQQGCSADMLFGIDRLISLLSVHFTLRQGDLVFTGTPAGVGPVHIDDHLEGWLGERKVLEFNCK
ncbi:MAG: fumarylacetoacetate hydrolase family protein [Prevotella sp.]|nr:fumarylacetoacetate hydrolase family protein [Prevotella sp.]